MGRHVSTGEHIALIRGQSVTPARHGPPCRVLEMGALTMHVRFPAIAHVRILRARPLLGIQCRILSGTRSAVGATRDA